MSDIGYIKLFRKVKNHRFWKQKRKFSRMEAWLDLLIEAAWKDHTIIVQDRTIHLRRGEVPHSNRTLAKRWGWSTGTVFRFILDLKAEHEADQRMDRGLRLLSIVNYDAYQSDAEKVDQQTDQQTDHARITRGSRADQTEEGKEGKEELPIVREQKNCSNFESQFSPTNQVVLGAWRSARDAAGLRYVGDMQTKNGAAAISAMVDSGEVEIVAVEAAMKNLMKDADAREKYTLNGLARNLSQWITAKDASRGSKPAAPKARTKRFVGKCECGREIVRGMNTSGSVWWEDCQNCGKNVDLEQDGFIG